MESTSGDLCFFFLHSTKQYSIVPRVCGEADFFSLVMTLFQHKVFPPQPWLTSKVRPLRNQRGLMMTDWIKGSVKWMTSAWEWGTTSLVCSRLAAGQLCCNCHWWGKSDAYEPRGCQKRCLSCQVNDWNCELKQNKKKCPVCWIACVSFLFFFFSKIFQFVLYTACAVIIRLTHEQLSFSFHLHLSLNK